MAASARALSFLLLGLLLTFSPGALDVNPGLVARITDKGLEYGKKLWPSARRADLLGLAPGCSGYCGGTGWASSLRRRGLPSQAALVRTLCHLGTYLSWMGSHQPTETKIWVQVVDLGDDSRAHHQGEGM